MSDLEDRSREYISQAVSSVHKAQGFMSDKPRDTAERLHEVLNAIAFLQSAAAVMSLQVHREKNENAG